jgi:hypothetical protein
MAKNDATTSADPATSQVIEPVTTAAPVPGNYPLSLDEFCTRLSTTDKRVELIGAFHHAEINAGRSKDTESAFASRYFSFCNQPA